MSVPVHIEHLFPTPVYISKVDISGVKIIQDDSFSPGGPEDYMLSISKEFQILNRIEYSELRKTIDDHAKHFYHGILGYGEESYPEMTTSWFVKSLKGQRSDFHSHGNSIISGVLYLQTSEDCGNLTFAIDWNDSRKPIQLLTPRIQKKTNYNSTSCLFTPTNGMLIMFPSQLKHQVEINRSDKPRISIAFNYFIRGDIFTRFNDIDFLRL